MNRREVRIEKRPLTWLHPNPKNARKHPTQSIMAIRRSIEKFGFVNPIICRPTGEIIAGEGRFRAAERLKLKTVPVVVVDMSDTEALAYLVADNATTDLSSWDDGGIEAIALELAKTDFDIRDIGEFDFLNDIDFEKDAPPALSDSVPLPEVDKAEQLVGKWGVELGQVWRVGEHRIMCGDSSQALNLERLLDGTAPDLVLTDPPFDGEMTDLVRSVVLSCGDRAVVLTGQGQAFTLCNHDLEFRMDFVWIHGVPRSIGAANLPLFYHCSLVFCAKHGVTLGWNRPDINSGSVLWDGTGGYEFTSLGQTKHDSPFREILRGFDKVKTVIDPFMGSGSTLIACEKLHRRLFGMELDPVHFAVCLERLFKWGLRPEKLS